ncbi:thiol reductant ABC exporter subunit CydD [Spiractinospora alimapuensis]|uniref:thiol reductant ABC exporter subunit CydD n=1 Tax=Spiractinospora alimapuensis TaxID=2820884 RepID=UPI001F490E95|nr:thiol reductant ABC exporter subunit CydD [Spiractinospora alimapuensis]QVQ53670.1 thiol reductant ABC exporter subunit CydD [Spiractinospora alimapuensis]
MSAATSDGVRGLAARLPIPRGFSLALHALALAGAGAVVLQAESLATAITDLRPAALVWLAVAVAGRATVAGASRWVSGRTSVVVRTRLRAGLLRSTETGDHGARLSLVTRGLDGIDPYVADYLPRRAAAMVVPLTLVGWLAFTDLTSALIVVATLPLIPILGALVGMHTEAATRRRWRQLDRLGGHFLDAVAGLRTLRAFGRDVHQISEVRRSAEEHRRGTMSVLRIAFLSALVLELVAALSVALVAVPLGMRLLEGTADLRTALVVLLVAPEVYLPLRALGSAFHSAADAASATDRALGHASTSAPRPTVTSPHVATPDPASARIELRDVTVRYPDREEPALDRISCVFEAGERVALVGASGSGKSTLLRVIVGLERPAEGQVLVDGVDLRSLDLEEWRRRLAWVPQRPHVFTDTVAANITLGSQDHVPDPGRLRAAAAAAHAEEFCSTRGWDTVLRPDHLSAGQRQRLALARAAYRNPGLLLLDEPTSRLDLATEAELLSSTRGLMDQRRAIVVAHSPALVDQADRVVRLTHGAVTRTEAVHVR